MPHKIRVLVGKPGLDGHDRGAKVVAAALRDAGMEVIYTGLHQTPEQIVEAALQEDVDVVALSILSGAHMTLFTEVLELMKQRGISDKLLTGGGIIPAEDIETLGKMGVGRLFGPGASTRDIAEYIRSWFVEARGEEPLHAPPAERTASPHRRESEKAAKGRAPRATATARGKKAARAQATKASGKNAARPRPSSRSSHSSRRKTARKSAARR